MSKRQVNTLPRVQPFMTYCNCINNKYHSYINSSTQKTERETEVVKMCRGVEEEDRRSDDGNCRRLSIESPRTSVSCELCAENAAVYCENNLYDGQVLLARRHLRRVICTSCRKLTRRCLVGDHFNIVLPVIRTMARGEEDNSDHKVPFVFL